MPDAAPVTNTVFPASSFTRILPRASGHPRPKTPSVPGRHMTAFSSDWEACRMSVRVQVFGRRHDDPSHVLWRPASKKRQGTKSREVGHRRCNGRYGDLMAAPSWRVSATRARGDVQRLHTGEPKIVEWHLGGRVKCSNGRLVN